MTVTVFIGARVGIRIRVVAIIRIAHIARRLVALDVRGCGIAEPITIDVSIPSWRIHSAILVDTSITIIVVAVTVLTGPRIRGGVRVVAIGVVCHIACGLDAIDVRHGGVTVAITVRIRVPSGHIQSGVFVDLAITIIVVAIAKLVGQRIGVGIRIVTIRVVQHIGSRLIARQLAYRSVAIGVAVGVMKPRTDIQGIILVDNAIAIVVMPITVFWCTRESRGVCVVAIPVVQHIPTGFYASPLHRGLIPVGIRVSVSIPCACVSGFILVCIAITIVINAIADLIHTWVYIGIKIIAVVPAKVHIDKAVVVLVAVNHFKNNRITGCRPQPIDRDNRKRVPTQCQVQKIKLSSPVGIRLRRWMP